MNTEPNEIPRPAQAAAVGAGITDALMPAPRRGPQAKYQLHQLLTAAAMAGAGCSASEIAEALGQTTTARVYALLSKHRIPLVRKAGSQKAATVVLDRKAFAAIADHAFAAGIEPEILAGRLLEEVTEDADLLRSLVVDATWEGRR